MKSAAAMTRVTSSANDGPSKNQRGAQEFWARYFNFYDTLNEAVPYRKMIDRQVELLAPSETDLVLDAGTGTGNVAVALIARRAQVIGVDFCEPALEICRRKVPEGDFRFNDLTQPLSFPSNHFHKIACCCVLHVFDGPMQSSAIREFFRVLRPGGTMVLTAFAIGFSPVAVYLETLRARREAGGLLGVLWFACRYSFNTLRIIYYVSRIKRRERTGEYNFFSSETLDQALAEAGFQVTAIERIFADQCLTAVAVKPVV